MREKQRLKTESQILFEKIFEENSDAIAIADDEFDIERTNPAFKTLTGFPVSDLKGKKLSVLSPKKKAPNHYPSNDANVSTKNSSASKGRSKT
ncbi:MAG: PAS domain-containing protein [Xanthomonadaceae bacterium]|nr:PAS domain-containing protein [Xanthomonadaceae bacterium]